MANDGMSDRDRIRSEIIERRRGIGIKGATADLARIDGLVAVLRRENRDELLTAKRRLRLAVSVEESDRMVESISRAEANESYFREIMDTSRRVRGLIIHSLRASKA